tara:strand:- start:55 stop:240 length:186 start_codon:yes stop_codon:yes gene_type:complete
LRKRCADSLDDTFPSLGVVRMHERQQAPWRTKADLVECLRTNDEHGAKAVFLSYDEIHAIA